MDLAIAVSLLILGQLCCLFLGAALAKRYLNRKETEYRTAILSEIQCMIEGKPCRTATILNAVAASVGREAGTSAKAALMADLAHASRQANNAKNENQLSLISEVSPTIGGALASVGPNRLGALMKNPLIGMLLSAMANRGQSSGDNGGGSKAASPKSFTL